jgi:hypothetical protein
MFHDIQAMQSAKLVLGIEGGGQKPNGCSLIIREDSQTIRTQGALPASNLKLISDDTLAHLFSVLPVDATHVGAFLAGCGTEDDRQGSRAW